MPHHQRAARDTAAPGQRGSVTAELALTLPAVVLVLLLVITLGAASVTQLRCTDAARAGARAAALGHSHAQVHQIVTDRAGADAQVQIEPGTDEAGDSTVTVGVTRPLTSQGWGNWRVSAEFTAVAEPTGQEP